jgi:pectate lyase
LPYLASKGDRGGLTTSRARGAGVVVAANGTVVGSALFDNHEPDGFGRGTTGGLGGRVYVVTSTADTEVYGTLHYGVERLVGPRWIVFHPNVFPPAVKTSIDPQRPLNVSGSRSDDANNLTIDGRGSWVSIRRSISWDDMEEHWFVAGTRTPWDPGDETTIAPAYECHEKDNVGPIVQIRSAKNIIITHIDFAKVRTGTPPPTPSMSVWLDDQCFDDMITVYNGDSERATTYYDRIWINNSEFRNCGDECVTVYSASTAGIIAGVTLSRNLFANTHKGLMIGGARDQYASRRAFIRIASSIH